MVLFANGIARACYDFDNDEEVTAVLHILCGNAVAERRPRHRYDRINWEAHVNELLYTRKFQSRYHMSKESFDKLVDIKIMG